jgi:putative hydrolase
MRQRASHSRRRTSGHVVTMRSTGTPRRSARAAPSSISPSRVAVEINSRPEREDPPDDLIALALERGCLFSIDSDDGAGIERRRRARAP